jgi:hypothetical protein
MAKQHRNTYGWVLAILTIQYAVSAVLYSGWFKLAADEFSWQRAAGVILPLFGAPFLIRLLFLGFRRSLPGAVCVALLNVFDLVVHWWQLLPWYAADGFGPLFVLFTMLLESALGVALFFPSVMFRTSTRS